MKALYTLIKPVVTEKAIKMGDKMIYAFYVHSSATKIDVKMAIKEAYGHEVATVKMLKTPAKKRTVKKYSVNKRPLMKKALITLKGKKKMDITKISKEPTKK